MPSPFQCALRGVLLVMVLGSIAGPAFGVSGTAGTVTATPTTNFQITSLDAPATATDGTQISVSATAKGTEDLNNEITLAVYRLDTGTKLCEATAPVPGTVSCNGEFEMPAEDVELRAVLRFATGQPLDDRTTTVTLDSESVTPTNTPTDTPPGDHGTPTDTSTSSGDDDGGMLETVFEGLTDAGQTALEATISGALSEFLIGLLLPSAKNLITMAFGVLTWTPAVHPNPAVEEVHRDTLRVTMLISLLAVMLTGLLYQVGPLVGVSYREVRRILPRIIIALLFAAGSLPILQLFVDLANALTQAFQPELLDASLGGIIGSMTAGSVVLLALFVNTFLLLAVVAVYLVLDVYVLFVAAISPLIAIAWAVPQTRRYAQAFIGGWWTALAAGPLAMLVLKFVFALLAAKGATPIQSVTNWMFGVVGFTMLLVLPFQLYGASKALVGRTFATVNTVQHGAMRRVRQYRQAQQSGPNGYADLDEAAASTYDVDFDERGAFAREQYRKRYRREYGEPGTTPDGQQEPGNDTQAEE